MLGWIQILLVVASIGILIFLLFFFTHRFCCHRKQPLQQHPIDRVPSLTNGIAKLHHHHDNQNNLYSSKKRTNYYVFRRGLSSKPLFNWSDNPSLITDAVENGWSRFAFTNYTSSPSVISNRSLLGSCTTASDGGGDVEAVEISWEVCQGSADFMQKIRLNSGLKKTITTTNSLMAAASVIKSVLPLPGPALGNSSPFPQEAYFEITVLSHYEDQNDSDVNGKTRVNKEEGEKIKLIQESPAGEKSKSESLIHVTSSNSNGVNARGVHVKFEEFRGRSVNKDIVEGKSEVAIMLSVGLTGGGSPPLKFPGTYPGSIGFNSNGSVYLDGVKLVFESETEGWGRKEKVIGCGYNPSQKKVFFTIDSQLVHEIHCKAEEFGTPLYPTLAANSEVMVLVNFGQSVFKYGPANLQRTPNPCFIGPLANSPALGYEDSKELFSMGRIDSQWLNRSTTRSAPYYHNGSLNSGTSEYDEVSEGDLFEIVLDSHSCGRSPSTPF